MLTVVAEVEHYKNILHRFKNSHREPDWLVTLREQAIAYLEEKGFPDSHQEDWRFTNVAPIIHIPFTPPSLSVFPETVTVQDLYTIRLTNGIPSALPTDKLPEGVILKSLRQAVLDHPDLVSPFLGKSIPYSFNGFTALNTALFPDGVFLFIPEGVSPEKPFHLLYSNDGEENALVCPRNLIVILPGSRVALLESYESSFPSRYFTSAVTEIILGSAAMVEHCKLQQESRKAFHVAATAVEVKRDSEYVSCSVTLGAQLHREDLQVLLSGPGGSCLLNGLYIPSVGQHMDHHTAIDHAAPHTTSHELYKGVLYGDAVFNGKIVVRKEAQQTSARQVNKNLVFSRHAHIHTKPELQILADDVKCSHGATIGQLDPEAIFYFNSRGIDQKLAASLLTFGFAAEVVDGLKTNELADGVRNRISEKLHQEGMG